MPGIPIYGFYTYSMKNFNKFWRKTICKLRIKKVIQNKILFIIFSRHSFCKSYLFKFKKYSVDLIGFYIFMRKPKIYNRNNKKAKCILIKKYFYLGTLNNFLISENETFSVFLVFVLFLLKYFPLLCNTNVLFIKDNFYRFWILEIF